MTRKQFIKKANREFSHLSDTDLKSMLCGQFKGHGASRSVYQCKMHHDFVVKVQYNGRFDNVIEYQIWDAISMADWWAKWFAECVFISRTGKVMIQQKIVMNNPKELYPKKIPKFFTDIKIENYGFLGDQLKCCDYSYVLDRLTGFMDKKMRVARWGKAHG